jgi:hypothetical protein
MVLFSVFGVIIAEVDGVGGKQSEETTTVHIKISVHVLQIICLPTPSMSKWQHMDCVQPIWILFAAYETL